MNLERLKKIIQIEQRLASMSDDMEGARISGQLLLVEEISLNIRALRLLRQDIMNNLQEGESNV